MGAWAIVCFACTLFPIAPSCLSRQDKAINDLGDGLGASSRQGLPALCAECIPADFQSPSKRAENWVQEWVISSTDPGAGVHISLRTVRPKQDIVTPHRQPTVFQGSICVNPGSGSCAGCTETGLGQGTKSESNPHPRPFTL